jgi:tetratricopeptide (TPR) repeat protein
MKKNHFIFFTVIALFLLNACTKQINDAFQNPNALTKQPIELLLPNIVSAMATSYTANGTGYGTQYDAIYTGKYIQFWSAYTAGDAYDEMGGVTGSSDLLGSIWAMHYYGMGANLERLMQWGEEQQKWDYVGVGHAIRAWGWLTLTDMYGDAILKEAFDASRRVFDYDSQQDIYAEVKNQCNLALENLNKTGDSVSQANLARGDQYFYNGDVSKWKKFTYSVLARLYNRTTNKADYNPDSVIYYANLAINDNADNGYVKFQGLGTATNSYYGPFRGNFGSLRQSAFIANLETGLNSNFPGVSDPRAWYLLRLDSNGTFKGVTPTQGSGGLTIRDRPENFWGGIFSSTTGSNNSAKYIFKDAAPFPIITAPEIQFLKAEAYYRKGDKPNALAAYKQGIGLSFDMLLEMYSTSVPAGHLITDQLKNDYINDPVIVPTDPADLTLSDIMLQKYIAMYGYGVLETWVDMRRFHYTDVEAGTNREVYTDFAPPPTENIFANNNGKWVYRARPRYNSEYIYNIDALQKVGALDLDYNTKEMWFSQP